MKQIFETTTKTKIGGKKTHHFKVPWSDSPSAARTPEPLASELGLSELLQRSTLTSWYKCFLWFLPRSWVHKTGPGPGRSIPHGGTSQKGPAAQLQDAALANAVTSDIRSRLSMMGCKNLIGCNSIWIC